MKGSGILLKRSKRDKENAELLVKTVFNLLMRISSLSSFQNYVKSNQRNMYNVFASMFNGDTTIDFSDKKIIGLDKEYNKLVKSNGFYNVFPQEYSYFPAIVSQAEQVRAEESVNISEYIKNSMKQRNDRRTKTNRKTSSLTSRLIKTPGKTKKRSSSNNDNSQTQLTYNEFEKMTKSEQGELIGNINSEDDIMLELSILYRYVYIALFIKKLLVKQLFELYKEKYEQKENDEYTKYYKELMKFYYNYNDGSRFFSARFIDEITVIIFALKPMFKEMYICSISSSYIIKSLEKGEDIPVKRLRKVFTVKPFIPELLERLYNEMNIYTNMKEELEKSNNNK
jgi:hypothetical protein